jgi:O-antigen biosynthesis protein
LHGDERSPPSLRQALSLWWLVAPAVAGAYVTGFSAAVASSFRPSPRDPHPHALRALVAFLHVLQPLARSWGRLLGRPAPELPSPSAGWTGDREAWLHELERELGRRGCRVRSGSAASEWDLEAAHGPLVAARLTAAVAWRWFPRYRLRLRPRPLVLLSVALGAFLVRIAFPAGAVVLTTGALGASVDAIVVRRIVRRAVQTTTAGRLGWDAETDAN